ncbi:DUF4362 domain-containing protein [Paenibacillus sp. GCM10023252]|uniref:DUF4362 domain-containing protein n=1 Tax=Paenibacillus sp. GCM10023252 TaxID=3252649 RepID=UPI003619FDCA
MHLGKLGLAVLMSLILFGVLGCAEEEPAQVETSPSPTLAASPTPLVRKEGVKVEVRFYSNLVKDSDLLVEYDREEGQVFTAALSTGVRMKGIMKSRQPDYRVTVAGESAPAEVILWLNFDKSSGMYRYESDPDTHYTLTEASAQALVELMSKLEYSPEQAEKNGDLVNVHGQISNLSVWKKFTGNVEAGKQDAVRVTSYTTEGGAVFDHLSFDGKSIQHIQDGTLDAWGSRERILSYCEGLDSDQVEGGIRYKVTGCREGSVSIPLFTVEKLK